MMRRVNHSGHGNEHITYPTLRKEESNMFWDWISYKWYIHIFYHWVIKLGAFKSFKLMEMICNSCFQGNAPSTSSNSPVLHRDFIYSSWWINDSEHPKPHTQMGNQRGYSKWWYIEKYLFIQKKHIISWNISTVYKTSFHYINWYKGCAKFE